MAMENFEIHSVLDLLYRMILCTINPEEKKDQLSYLYLNYKYINNLIELQKMLELRLLKVKYTLPVIFLFLENLESMYIFPFQISYSC